MSTDGKTNNRDTVLKIKAQIENIAPLWVGALVPIGYGFINNRPGTIVFLRKPVFPSMPVDDDFLKLHEAGARLRNRMPTILEMHTSIHRDLVTSPHCQFITPGQLPDVWILTAATGVIWGKIADVMSILVARRDEAVKAGKANDNWTVPKVVMDQLVELWRTPDLRGLS